MGQWNDQFSKAKIKQGLNMRKCSTLLAMEAMKIKITSRLGLILLRRVTNNKYWRESKGVLTQGGQ